MRITRSIWYAVIVTAAGGFYAVAANAAPPAQGQAANPDWPCVQHKVPKLTSSQIWDGPPVEDLDGWKNDDAIRKLVPVLVSRRIPMEEIEPVIKTFAEGQPAETRDRKLSELLAAVLSNINTTRASVLDGIERFQRRQNGRSKELERQGLELAKLHEKSASDDKAKEEAAKAQERYDWDARVFQERERNVPLACEIPVLIEQRVFDLGRAIRSHMKS